VKTRGSVTRAFSKVSSLEGVKSFWIATAANQGPVRSYPAPHRSSLVSALGDLILPLRQAPERE